MSTSPWVHFASKTSIIATLFRFCTVGALATLAYFISANALTFLRLFEPATASIVAYVIGMIVSFVGQSRFTFLVMKTTAGQVLRFSLMSAIGLLFSYYAVVWCMALQVPPIWGTVATSIFIPLMSFVIMKVWVFRP